MAWDISITLLRYFVRVAELRNISRAAESLYISQPTLSRQLAGLEKQLGVTLMQKTRTGVALTPEGIALQEKALHLLSVYDRFVEDISHLDAWMQGSVSIAYQKSSEEFLQKCNRTFLNLYPNITLDCVRQGHKNIVTALEDGKFDVVYVNSLDVEGHPQIQSIRLFSQDEWLLVPRTNPLCKKKEVKFSDLVGQRFVMTSRKTARLKSDLQIAACQKYNVVPNIVKYADNLDEFLMDILTYDAICFMPYMRGVENDYVKYVKLSGHEARISTSIAWIRETDVIRNYIKVVQDMNQ